MATVLTNVCVLGGSLACTGMLCVCEELRRVERQRRQERRRRRRIERRLSSSRATWDDEAVGGGDLRRVSSMAARRTAQVVADRLREAVIGPGYRGDWGAAFAAMDRSGNGDLTAAEFASGIRSLTGTRLSAADLDELMYEIDRNGDDRINYREFIAAFSRADAARDLAEDVTEELRAKLQLHRENLFTAFARMDSNKDGVLTMSEFQRGLRQRGIQLTGAEMKALMRVVDQDGDGSVDYGEFMRLVLDDDTYGASADDDIMAHEWRLDGREHLRRQGGAWGFMARAFG
eukprot:COSAG05_NODE_638_length_8163_cov_16.318452_6_plen_289_part_00